MMGNVNLKLPDKLHKETKAEAALKGILLKDYLIELIKRGRNGA